MAKLLKGIAPEFREIVKFQGSWEESYELEKKAFEAIEERTTIVKQQVADGYAYYEVVKRRPFQIRYIPFLDKWEADPAWIRGLSLSDIRATELWNSWLESLGK